MGIYTQSEHRGQILLSVPYLKNKLFFGQCNIFKTPTATVNGSHKSRRSHFRFIL
jgi:hypothetical protein